MIKLAMLAYLAAMTTPDTKAHGLSPELTRDLRELEVSRYSLGFADLNGDGRKEMIIYSRNANFCGTSNCRLFVLSPKGNRFRVVTKVAATQLPICLLPTISHGWHDISVHVEGGGISPGFDVRLRFDGKRYPGNPTMLSPILSDARKGIVVLAN